MRASGFRARLLAALALVLLTAGATAWVIAAVIGPAVFHDHLVETAVGVSEAAAVHAEIAFREASALALAIGFGLGAVVALAVSVVLTRRVGASLGALSTAARDLADGRLEARVPAPRLGGEFADLATAFNQMADRLEASERLRERLLSDVAHELRTPVATLTAYLEAIEDGVAEWNPETIALLRAQGERLTRLAEDLSAVTRAESGELALDSRDLDLGGAIRLAVLAAQPRAATASVSLVVAVEHDLPRVTADPTRVAQMIGNLLENAITHTPAGGTVTVSAAPLGDTHIVLAVDDTGDGIAAEHLPHLFDRFYRVESARDRASGGSGIGLAIVRAIAHAHGGTVNVSSAGLGTGARFTVTLPVAGAAGR